jgi:hypothetical protein
MTMFWPFVPTVAAAEFDPLRKDAAMPVTEDTLATRPRPAAKPGAVTRPKRLNLLELGLACGAGAAELESRTAEAAAKQAQADGTADKAADVPGGDGEAENKAPAPDPRAIAAATSALQAMHRKRSRLAEELEALDQQEQALKAALMRLLNRGRPPPAPATPAPPAGAGLPTAAWR